MDKTDKTEGEQRQKEVTQSQEIRSILSHALFNWGCKGLTEAEEVEDFNTAVEGIEKFVNEAVADREKEIKDRLDGLVIVSCNSISSVTVGLIHIGIRVEIITLQNICCLLCIGVINRTTL